MTTERNKVKSEPWKLMVIVLISLVTTSIIVLIILESFSTLNEGSFGIEIGKALLQIISVGVVGTILSSLLARYGYWREDTIRNNELKRISEENRNQFRKDILHQLNEIYSEMKNNRRMLRAKAFTMSYSVALETDDAKVALDIYDNVLEDINNLQLQLEILMKEIETNQNTFTNWTKIKTDISRMEKYLGKLVKEYEENRTKMFADPTSLEIKDLDNLRKMLGHADDNNPFKTEFIIRYKEAISEVRKELLM